MLTKISAQRYSVFWKWVSNRTEQKHWFVTQLVAFTEIIFRPVQKEKIFLFVNTQTYHQLHVFFQLGHDGETSAIKGKGVELVCVPQWDEKRMQLMHWKAFPRMVWQTVLDQCCNLSLNQLSHQPLLHSAAQATLICKLQICWTAPNKNQIYEHNFGPQGNQPNNRMCRFHQQQQLQFSSRG